MNSEFSFGPRRLAHGRADGTFSLDDDLALAFRLAQCPSAPRPLVELAAGGRVDGDRLVDNIACARSWGASAAAVLARLDAEWPTTDENEVVRDSAREAASTEPALSLRGVCPVSNAAAQ